MIAKSSKNQCKSMLTHLARVPSITCDIKFSNLLPSAGSDIVVATETKGCDQESDFYVCCEVSNLVDTCMGVRLIEDSKAFM